MILWVLLAAFILIPALSLGETIDELTLEVLLDRPEVDVAKGEVITGTWEASGGLGPYTYVYYWKVYGEFQNSLDGRVSDTQSSFQPLFGDVGALYVNAQDSQGLFTKKEVPFTIKGVPGPLACEIQFDKANVMPGETVTATWTISGGKAPYEVTCEWVTADADYEYTTHPEDETDGSAAFAPDRLGSLRFRVKVRDQFSISSYFESDPLVIGSLDPILCSIAMNSLKGSVGDPVTATWTVSGGNPPFTVECSWRTSDADGNWQTYPEDETGGTASFVPLEGGWAYFRVSGHDARGDYFSESSDAVLVAGEKEQPGKYTSKMLNAKVAELASACMAVASGEYARAKWFHDWLTENARYDYSFTYYDAKGVLLAGKGVCQSFAEAYQLLLNKVGISNKLLSGKANNGTGGWEGHAWNLVKIGGNWYHVDVTWDDTGDRYEYFLKSDQSMSANHQWSTSRYPACPYDWGKEPGKEAIKGDADLSGVIDLQDLVVLIDYLVTGKAPASLDNANADGQGEVDIGDLVWIIDRIVGG
ncbi:MAG: transglutaminase domain-containing protein [Christensenellales bacterium]